MKPQYTHIGLVLDKSGSMDSIKQDTIGSVDKFIRDQKAVPGEATFQLVQFDTVYHAEAIHNIRDEPAFTVERYTPGGYTALLDAVGKAITDTGEFLRGKPDNERPSRVIIVIITDGLENPSKIYTRQQIFDMVQRQTDVYKWDFVFLGANIDSFAAAASFGIMADNVSNYNASPEGVKFAYAGVSAKIGALRRDRDTSKKFAFTKEEQDANEKAK